MEKEIRKIKKLYLVICHTKQAAPSKGIGQFNIIENIYVTDNLNSKFLSSSSMIIDLIKMSISKTRFNEKESNELMVRCITEHSQDIQTFCMKNYNQTYTIDI